MFDEAQWFANPPHGPYQPFSPGGQKGAQGERSLDQFIEQLAGAKPGSSSPLLTRCLERREEPPKQRQRRFMSPLERQCPALGTTSLPKSSILAPPMQASQALDVHPKTQVTLGFQMEQLKHTNQESEPKTNNPGDKWGGGLNPHGSYPESQRASSTRN